MKRQLKIAIILALVGGLLTAVAFVMAFTTAQVREFGLYTSDKYLDTSFAMPPGEQPLDGGIAYARPWFAQKIFYFHVPVAEASFLVFTFAAVYAVLFLVKRKKSYDTRSRVGMEATLVFTIATMVTGSLWTVAAWLDGNWARLGRELLTEPRLATYSVMLIFVIAYFVLRNSVEDEERRATYAAAFSILAWINAPISFFITRVVDNATHPVVFQAGMDTSNLIPFIIAQIGMLMIGYAIYALRVSEENLRDTLELIKEEMED